MAPKPAKSAKLAHINLHSPRKPRKSHHHNPSADHSPQISINATKSQIRSLSRLLSNPSSTLPAPILIEKERQLASLNQDLTTALATQQRSKLITKYHKIRFFERQKATRLLKKAKRAVALWESWLLEKEQQGQVVDDGEEGKKMERLRREVHEREVDVAYAVNYPLGERYVGLFPKGQEEGVREKPPVWEWVELCLADGSLGQLRDGGLDVRADGSVGVNERGQEKELTSSERMGKESKGQNNAENGGDDGEGSDGGFFER